MKRFRASLASTALLAAGCVVASLSLASISLHAQSPAHSQASAESDWWNETSDRVKAIYDRGEFRPNPFRARWLPESSGYIVRARDPDDQATKVCRVDALTGEKMPVEADAESRQNGNPRISPDGKRSLETRNDRLLLRDKQSGQSTRLLEHQPERDINYRNFAWSPDGKYVAFVEADSTGVRRRAVLVPTDPSYPDVRYDTFARVGETITQLRVGMIEIATKQLRWIDIDAPDEGIYLGQVEWAGNSEELLIEKLSRFRDKREFLLATFDGEITSIYSETDEAWAIGSQQISMGLNWIRDGEAFVVVTEKDGWRHAYLYSREGKEIALLTPGEYEIIDRAVIDEARGWFYFYASPDNGTQKYLYRVPLDGSGELTRVSPADQAGTHEYEFSPDASWAFHTYSTLDSPPTIQLVRLPEHDVVRVLEDNSDLRSRAQEVIAHPTEFLQLAINEDVTVDAWMIKPRDFDPAKKYPLFVYVYGEPYSQTVLDRWGAAQIHFHRVIADLGYLVVSIDNRGTPSPKGAAWRRSIFGSLGPLSTEEQAAALKQLGRTQSFVDLSRIGIWGWSGGGSNTLNAMFRKPDLYDVGIAVVPKPQPHLYNAWFQEIYMRDRETNPEGYQKAAPINFAERLKGDLLIITGSGETNTHIQIIEGLVDRLIELGKPFDYMVYPNRDHGLREGPGSVVHVRMLIIRYLVNHLAPGGRAIEGS